MAAHSLKEKMKQAKALCENRLSELLISTDADAELLYESMRYSVMAGGKRIRPFLVLAFSELFAGDARVALNFACALEMVHTYSLIHDDLPSMDNDDYRRGMLTNHKKYGEATALLAGDALLTYAFSVIADAGAEPSATVSAVRALADSAGPLGMLGGQMMDKAAEEVTPDLFTLERLQSRKTGALMRVAAELGLLAAGVTDQKIRADALTYADRLGRAFQIKDDLLDLYGDEKLLGKQVGRDVREGKTTYPSLVGVEKASEELCRLTEEAKAVIAPYTGAELLIALAEEMTKRKS